MPKHFYEIEWEKRLENQFIYDRRYMIERLKRRSKEDEISGSV